MRRNKGGKKLSTPVKVLMWFGIGIGGILVLLFILFTVLSFTSGGEDRVGRWRSDEGKREYETAYEEVMSRMPPFSDEYTVETEFGTVRAYRWSNETTEGTTPIVLLPGRSSGVPMWQENIGDLVGTHPVYALDALGDSGMSVQTRPITNSADQAKWLDQTLAGLGLETVHMVGHSFGGWSAANYASHYPDRLVSLSLIEPVRVFTDLSLKVYLYSIPASLPFLPQSWRDFFLSRVGGAAELDPSDPMTRMIMAATEHYAAALPIPDRITPEQMRSWPVPVYVAMGADSVLHNSEDAVKTAEANVVDLRIRNWPGGTHSLPMEQSGAIGAELLQFMQQAELE